MLIASTAVTGWALATRIWPEALAENVLGARLSGSLHYWNALGAMAALGAPAALWLGSRREGGPLLRALAFPAMGVLVLTVLLTQSRGALAAAVLAALIWIAVVPLRLRSITVIAVAALAVAPVAAWALSKDAFTQPLQPTSAREAVAGDFGLMLALALAVLLAAGLAVGLASSRRPPSLAVRRRAGIALAVVACLFPFVALTSVAMSDRGLTGTVSDRVDDLTDEGAPPEGGARFGSLSSSRGGYWRQAREVFEEYPGVGSGAGTFALSSLPYRKDGSSARHAHGFLAQTIADLGLLGLAAVLALLAAWLAAAARATGFLPRRRPGPGWPPERTAVFALALCAVVFGLHSVLDWIWFVPGPTVAALVAAGFVAGRGPRRAVGEREPVSGDDKPARGPARAVAAAAVLATALICAWAVWQPERAHRATDNALAALDRGDLDEAADEAERARDVDPYSPEPLWAQAEVLAEQRRLRAAYRTFEQAVIEHPHDPESWLRLGRFELDEVGLPPRALETATVAMEVDPRSRQAAALRDRAQAALEALAN